MNTRHVFSDEKVKLNYYLRGRLLQKKNIFNGLAVTKQKSYKEQIS